RKEEHCNDEKAKEKLGRTPTRLEVFEADHKRKDGTYINDHVKDFMVIPVVAPIQLL
ncbi:unnamed protein product, partial [Linum tenue]